MYWCLQTRNHMSLKALEKYRTQRYTRDTKHIDTTHIDTTHVDTTLMIRKNYDVWKYKIYHNKLMYMDDIFCLEIMTSTFIILHAKEDKSIYMCNTCLIYKKCSLH